MFAMFESFSEIIKLLISLCELVVNSFKIFISASLFIFNYGNEKCKRISTNIHYFVSEQALTSSEVVHSNEIKKKKTKITACDRKVLESWFESNKSYPYATSSDLINLSLITKLNVIKVKRWIENKRRKTKEAVANIPAKLFNEDDKKILLNFFQTKSDHPGPQDLEFLENVIQKDRKKIRNWFNYERSKSKSLFPKER